MMCLLMTVGIIAPLVYLSLLVAKDLTAACLHGVGCARGVACSAHRYESGQAMYGASGEDR